MKKFDLKETKMKLAGKTNLDTMQPENMYHQVCEYIEMLGRVY